MMKRRVGFVAVMVLAVILFGGVCFLSPAQSQARNVVPVEGSKFDTSSSLADNLRSHVGKDVFLHLKSGQTLQGKVKAVGNNLLHLEKLVGKDFYDALILVEEINAMEAKFREMK